MIKEIQRKYLEIKSLKDLNEVEIPAEIYSLNLTISKDFQINKFFYKQIGKKHHWADRLEWTDQSWINYLSQKNVSTFILKDYENPIGYYELIFHKHSEEAEISYFGILEEYFGKKLGGFLLSEAIKNSFFSGAKRVWVHTCSLDHKNALKNYISRGMDIYKSEIFRANFI